MQGNFVSETPVHCFRLYLQLLPLTCWKAGERKRGGGALANQISSRVAEGVDYNQAPPPHLSLGESKTGSGGLALFDCNLSQWMQTGSPNKQEIESILKINLEKKSSKSIFTSLKIYCFEFWLICKWTAEKNFYLIFLGRGRIRRIGKEENKGE